jgi:ABC-type sugar transport system permease subunit
VILPLLKPALQVALLFRIIFAFEVFASVIAITGRNDARGRVAARSPSTSTRTSPPRTPC